MYDSCGYCIIIAEIEEANYINSFVRRDEDGYWYLDFLRQPEELDYPEYDYYTILVKIRDGSIIGILDGLSVIEWIRMKLFELYGKDKLTIG